LLIKMQRQATEVSAAEARSRMGILEATGVDALGLVEDGEGDKAAAVEAGEGAQAASRKKGNALHKAMSAVGVVIATSLAIMKALASTIGPPTTFVLAGIAGAMGAVQLATIMAAATGGRITHGSVDVTGGGKLRGAGSGTSDSIPAMLSNGEYVINAAQTQKYAGVLAAINQGKTNEEIAARMATGRLAFASGGMVGKAPTFGGNVDGSQGNTYNTTHINISGNVDQRSIDQIRGVISSSPTQVENATAAGKRAISGLRRPKGR
jgi:hypothetical protein